MSCVIISLVSFDVVLALRRPSCRDIKLQAEKFTLFNLCKRFWCPASFTAEKEADTSQDHRKKSSQSDSYQKSPRGARKETVASGSERKDTATAYQELLNLPSLCKTSQRTSATLIPSLLVPLCYTNEHPASSANSSALSAPVHNPHTRRQHEGRNRVEIGLTYSPLPSLVQLGFDNQSKNRAELFLHANLK